MNKTIYIDANASNSSVIDSDFNNRYTYKLNDTIKIPAGSKISVQDSLINKQGITGGSIQIEEDLEETMVIGYYMSDTDLLEGASYTTAEQNDQDFGTGMLTPVGVPTYYSHCAKHFNAKEAAMPNLQWNWGMGWSELPMPLVGFRKAGDQTVDGPDFMIPITNKIKIKIPRGTYSIVELSNLLTDQINGVKINGTNESIYDIKKKNSGYTGDLTNTTTSRWFSREASVFDPGDNTLGGWWNYYTTYPVGAKTVQDSTWYMPRFGSLIGGEDYRTGEDTSKKPHGAIGMKPSYFNELVEYYKTFTEEDIIQKVADGLTDEDWRKTSAVLGSQRASPNADPPTENWFPYGEVETDAGIKCEYWIGIITNDNSNQIEQELAVPNSVYDLYNSVSLLGMGQGSTGFQLKYDSTNSGFSFNNCHQVLFQPTTDMFGNDMPNPGEESVYLKRVNVDNVGFEGYDYNYIAGVNSFSGNVPVAVAGRMSREQRFNMRSVLTNVMSRSGGFFVYNWGFDTASKSRTNKKTTGDDFKRFDEFYNSDSEARTNWKTTIWYKLGFTYDDIQNIDNWESGQYYLDEERQTLPGFTTNTVVDTSVIPQVSTIWNSSSLEALKAGTNPTGETGSSGIIRATTGVKAGTLRSYNLMDLNSPRMPCLNISSKIIPVFEDPQPIGTELKYYDALVDSTMESYQHSFYAWATMYPVLTQSSDYVASRLPVLSQHGYMIITSDIIAAQDYVSKDDNLPLMDIVPISSLSNQDFISNRNVMVHNVTNDIILNAINIAILNPDLTNVTLNPNSSIIFKIEYPLPEPTVVLANNNATVVEQTEIQSASAINTQIDKQEAKKV